MSDRFVEAKAKLEEGRPVVMMAVMLLFGVILTGRLFVLQIVRGEEYQKNYNLKVEKTEVIDATRGNIYDRNGKLLAYNELTYAVTIEDNKEYESTKEKNEDLNSTIYNVIVNLEKNGDKIDNDFGITMNSAGEYSFLNSGTAQMRFRADIFGYSDIDDLKSAKNSKYGIDEAECDADTLMEYLCGEKRYQISEEEYGHENQYKICTVRYNLSQNSYQKYIATPIASSINEKSLAYIKENLPDLTGIDVEERSVRKYNNSECMANIIGYTGKISTDEYNEMSKTDESVSLNDVIGKSGIEQYMEDTLSGTKGFETVYVDSVGNVISESEHKDPVSGGHVYLSIDADLQQKTYDLLEHEIAGILYSKIQNIKEFNASGNTNASDIVIPIYDVYFALINNNLIDISHLKSSEATSLEKSVYTVINNKLMNVRRQLVAQFSADDPVAYRDLPKEYMDYSTYVVKELRAQNVLLSDSMDQTDKMYQKWTNEELAVKEYLYYCLEMNWIDITKFVGKSKYVDTDELYDNLVDYIDEEILTDKEFEKEVYHYAILNDEVTGNQLCTILYDQKYFKKDKATRDALANGSISAYGFLKEKIRTLTLKPGDLALDPCSGSSVIIDTRTGEVLACVSYPGYDNNKLANSVDSSYYSSLVFSLSNPMYNHATQQRTAPGSTFKLCSSVAGLSEGVIDVSTKIVDGGVFEKVSNKPKCWYYPASHGEIDVSEAIRDSCNYFFYEVGYRLAGNNHYNDATGINKITKYAKLFGLSEKTGVEIEENTPEIATEYPVMAAIGQSNHNFTTISLARYVTAIANSGTVYDLTLLDHITDPKGETTKEFGAKVKNEVDVIGPMQWNAIHSGMRMVVENLSEYDNFPIEVAGKTGTAQQDRSRPNHALFVGYAPYNNPRIAVATRIPFGYTSHNAAAVTKDILGVYFNVKESEQLDTSVVNEAAGGGGNAVTD